MDRRTTRPELRRGAIVAVSFWAGIPNSEAIVYHRLWRGSGKRKLELYVIHPNCGRAVAAEDLTFLAHPAGAGRRSSYATLEALLRQYHADHSKELPCSPLP
jgi:hypothetical protein